MPIETVAFPYVISLRLAADSRSGRRKATDLLHHIQTGGPWMFFCGDIWYSTFVLRYSHTAMPTKIEVPPLQELAVDEVSNAGC